MGAGSSSDSIISSLLSDLLTSQVEVVDTSRLELALRWRGNGSIFHELIYHASALEHLLRISRHADDLLGLLSSALNCRRPSDGATPLIMACTMGFERPAILYLQHGADPFSSDRTVARRTAIHWAAFKNFPSLIPALIEHSISYSSSNSSGEPPSALRRWTGAFKASNFLTQQQEECIPLVDLQTQSGFTALMYAAWCNNWNCAQALIRAGASIHERRRGKWKALLGYSSPSQDQTLGSECPDLATTLHICALRGSYRTARTILTEHLRMTLSEPEWIANGYRLSRESPTVRSYDPRMMTDAKRATPFLTLGSSSLISLRRNRPLTFRILSLLDPQTPLLSALGGAADEEIPSLVLTSSNLPAAVGRNVPQRQNRPGGNSRALGPMTLKKIAALAVQKKLLAEIDVLKVEVLEHNRLKKEAGSTRKLKERECRVGKTTRERARHRFSLPSIPDPTISTRTEAQSPSLSMLGIADNHQGSMEFELDLDVRSSVRGGSTSTRLEGISEEEEEDPRPDGGGGRSSNPFEIPEALNLVNNPWPMLGGASTPASPTAQASSHSTLSLMNPPPLAIPSPTQKARDWLNLGGVDLRPGEMPVGSTRIPNSARVSRVSSRRSAASSHAPSTAFSDDHASMCGVCLDDGRDRDGDGDLGAASSCGVGFLRIHDCSHKICAHCAHELISLQLHVGGLAPCPFCRGPIRGFSIFRPENLGSTVKSS